MIKNKPIIVNMLAGPGAGKSTGAYYITGILKNLGVRAELVTEYAKDKVWEKNAQIFAFQATLFGKQVYRIGRVADPEHDVKVIVTDSPLILSALYNKDEVLGDNFNQCVVDTFNSYDNLNCFITRIKAYDHKGRWQNEEEAKECDKILQDVLHDFNVDYDFFNGDLTGYNQIIECILRKLGMNDAIRYIVLFSSAVQKFLLEYHSIEV